MSLDVIRETMRDYLLSAGMEAVCAWPEGARERRSAVVAAVSLRELQGGPGGFQDYLGERYDRASGKWQELYGKRATARLGLDLYGPTAAEVQKAVDRLCEILRLGGPEGLQVQEISCGEIAYQGKAGLYCCPAEAQCGLYLYAMAEEGGTFLDFEVRGKGTI